MATTIPQPTPDEDFEQYSIRASRELFEAIPQPEERNQAIRETWHAYRGPTEEEQVADATFDPAKYSRANDICVFAEHETKNAKGEARKYGLPELLGIVRNCNERIRERRAFAAIADRHTSNPDDQHPVDPQVLGYAGNYRIGLIGTDKPTWAIFGDEFRFHEAEPIFDQKRRRSVELWTDKETGRAWFDPITTCGADAPRLPLPAQYQQIEREGASLERYTCAAPGGGYASAGAGSTYVKSHKEPQPTKYGGTPGMDGMMNPEQLNQIVDAILATPQMQWVTSQMNEAPAGPGGMDQLPEPEEAPAGDATTVPPAGETPAPGDDNAGGDLASLDDLLGGDEEPGGASPPPPGAPPDEEDEQERFSMSRTNTGVTVEKYAALQRSHQALIQDHARMHDRVQVLERSTADANRTARLQQLQADHPGFIDLEEELKAALYSMGANMSDAQFDAHIADVEKYAARAVPQVNIPTGEAAHHQPDAEKEQYAQKLSETAVQIATDAADAGKPISWSDARKQAEEQLKTSA